MEPARRIMAEALGEVHMRKPRVPLIANVTAASISDPNEIREKLTDQVTGMVRWRESVAAMTKAGVDVFFELGAGKILTGLARRNAPDARAVALGTPEEIAKALPMLMGEVHV
jgi:[acyl-carrier-protein] S-malonyltransferase